MRLAHPLATLRAVAIAPYRLGTMSALIITESLFGNTLAVAEAIARGIGDRLGPGRVRVVHASDAPMELPAGIELIVIGAPTHTLSLPNVGTRAAAIREGGSSSTALGIREWIEIARIPDGVAVATFDTAISSRVALGHAAQAATETLAERGVTAQTGPSFWVTGMEGPLADGELRRATEWGLELADRLP